PAISVPVHSASPRHTMAILLAKELTGRSLQRSSSAHGPYYPWGNPWTEPPRAVAYVEQPPEAPAPRHAITVMTGVPAREAGGIMERVRRRGISFGENFRRSTPTSSSSGKWSEAERDPGIHA